MKKLYMETDNEGDHVVALLGVLHWAKPLLGLPRYVGYTFGVNSGTDESLFGHLLDSLEHRASVFIATLDRGKWEWSVKEHVRGERWNRSTHMLGHSATICAVLGQKLEVFGLDGPIDPMRPLQFEAELVIHPAGWDGQLAWVTGNAMAVRAVRNALMDVEGGEPWEPRYGERLLKRLLAV